MISADLLLSPGDRLMFKISSVLHKLYINFKDIELFGVSIIQRFFKKKPGRSHGTDFVSIDTRIGPVALRPGNSDIAVLRQIFLHKEYDLDRLPQGAYVRKIYSDILRSKKVPLIIDAGANVGFAARFFARAYPQARIISVEPDAANITLCRENTKCLPQVEIVEAAIGSESGFVSIETSANNAWATRTHRNTTGVPVVTINELLSRSDDFELLIAKIDIEGFEKELFSQNTDWIERATTIIVEPHDWLFPDDGSSQTMQNVMLRHGRDLLILGENLIWMKRRTQTDRYATSSLANDRNGDAQMVRSIDGQVHSVDVKASVKGRRADIAVGSNDETAAFDGRPG